MVKLSFNVKYSDVFCLDPSPQGQIDRIFRIHQHCSRKVHLEDKRGVH